MSRTFSLYPDFSGPDTQLRTLESFISPARKEKAARYYFREDRMLSMYSELLLRRGLKDYLADPCGPLQFGCSQHGKPFLTGCDSIFFSLSHTSGGVLCAVSYSGEIGADIERIKDPPFHMMEAVYHPQEIQYVNQSEDPDRGRRFFEIWTRKEAYLKMTGSGLIRELSSLNTLALSVYFKTVKEHDYIHTICAEEKEAGNRHEQLSQSGLYEFFCGRDNRGIIA